MRVSKKTDYALRALFTLVEHYNRGPIPIRELARRNDVPKRFLEHIMLDLKAKGWVSSVPGLRGGYVLAKKPGQITMARWCAASTAFWPRLAASRFRATNVAPRNRSAGSGASSSTPGIM